MSESFSVSREEVQDVDESLVYNLRGEMLPLGDLRDMLGMEKADRDRYFVAVVGHGERRIGLMLDEILEQQEIIIKPLGGYFEGIKGYSGATELGRHEVLLVLDAESLINEAFAARKVSRPV